MHHASEYEAYMQAEWLLFSRDAARQQESARIAETPGVKRVLDVGCGAGQEMIPFAERGAYCVGIDVSHESGTFGRRMFGAHYPQRTVHFATAAAEHLPFPSNAFDVVVCRVAIPYTDNRAAIMEMGRVLRPGGTLLLKTHHLRYYVRKLGDGVRRLAPLYALHAARVMLTGAIYHATGRQPGGGLLLRETFMTEALLKKELRRAGLTLHGELPDSDRLAPSYRVVKAEAASPRVR